MLASGFFCFPSFGSNVANAWPMPLHQIVSHGSFDPTNHRIHFENKRLNSL